MPYNLSSRKAAEILGVGTSSVNRWADAGRLLHVRTRGGHRRFRRTDVESLSATLHERGPTLGSWVESWMSALLDAPHTLSTQGRLLEERGQRGSWGAVANALGDVLTAIGQRWATGDLSVLEEHAASERLGRALARCAESIPLGANPPRALLATAIGDEHTLGLSLAEVVLREQGWATDWAGRGVSTEDMAGAVLSGRHQLLVVSASSFSCDASLLRRQATALGRACEQANARAVLGGTGAWPSDIPATLRMNDFNKLRSIPAKAVP